VSIYSQHGYGKGTKIEAGLRDGALRGVILSPRNESPEKLSAFATGLRAEFQDGVTLLFDPQFYATIVPDARDGSLADYPYYRPGLTRRQFISQADVHEYAADTLGFQSTLDLDRWISPAVLFDDFRDPWSQIALTMAQESISVHRQTQNAAPLLLSLVLDENALRSRDSLDEFLDIITSWDVAGFYLVVRRNDRSYPAAFDDSVLLNLVYLVYVLAEVNEFEVVCGYTDLVGLLLLAVGGKAIASGWFNTLRQFSLSPFQPATGGRAPRARYTSAPLMSSVLVVPELATAYYVGRTADMLSNTRYDQAMANGDPANALWPPETACLHHWDVLARLAEGVGGTNVGVRLATLESEIRQAIARYALLQSSGVQFEAPTGPRDLTLWLRVVQAFRSEIGA